MIELALRIPLNAENFVRIYKEPIWKEWEEWNPTLEKPLPLCGRRQEDTHYDRTAWENYITYVVVLLQTEQEVSYPTVGSLRQVQNERVLEFIWIIRYQQCVKQSISVCSFLFFRIYFPACIIFKMLIDYNRQLQAKDCIVPKTIVIEKLFEVIGKPVHTQHICTRAHTPTP